MRGAPSILAIGGLAFAVWAGAVTTSAESARDRSAGNASPAKAVPAATPAPETDADRRERLNARLRDMVRSGQGTRLTETKPRREPRAPARTARVEIPAPRPTAVAAPRAETTPAASEYSTITPPAYNPRSGGRPTGRSYTPPRLDLTTPPRVPTNDIECLTQAIYYEARNESEEGQAAVAEVVINRSRAGTYPRKICEVVYQRNSRTCQFTFTCDGSIGRSPVNMTAWGRAERIARDVYQGRSQALLPRSSVNYHANYVRPSWGRRLERVRQIGAHIFYGSPLKGHSTPGAEAAPRNPAPTGLMFVRNEALDRVYEAFKAESPAPAGG